MRENRVHFKQPQILSGWKEIANYMGKGVRTVQRYERMLGLPVRRPAGKPCGSVVATTAEIDAWIAASPIRDGLQLLRSATEYSATTWSDIQSGAAKMKHLAQEMLDLRTELRSSVTLLRQTIRDVRGELDGHRAAREDLRLQTSVFRIFRTDVGRKAS